MMIIRMMLIHLIIGWLRCQQASHNSGRRRFEASSFNQEMSPERERGCNPSSRQSRIPEEAEKFVQGNLKTFGQKIFKVQCQSNIFWNLK